jgi:folate-dependent phosphoribosylglycinamide formyltransferase PurN
MPTLHLGFLASHGGSNMQAIINACKEGRLDARPCVVISNNSESMALQRAKNEGIPAYHLSLQTHPDPAVLDRAILEVLRRRGVDTVILAGYMKKLGPHTLQAYRGRILNIHPALLPMFGGQGMYGRSRSWKATARRRWPSGCSPTSIVCTWRRCRRSPGGRSFCRMGGPSDGRFAGS